MPVASHRCTFTPLILHLLRYLQNTRPSTHPPRPLVLARGPALQAVRVLPVLVEAAVVAAVQKPQPVPASSLRLLSREAQWQQRLLR